MKVLIFGAGGMIGHMMFRKLTPQFETFGTLRGSKDKYLKFGLFSAANCFDNVDVLDLKKTDEILEGLRPDVILNCVGITLRKPEIRDFEYCRKVNSEFPHRLHKWAAANGSFLIHFSTDCVFSGKDGPYTEDSPPSAEDVYGKTKAAGEVSGPNALTLRGSMIGRELLGKTELLEWALSQRNNDVKGFSRAIYSGVTTDVMAELVAKIIRSDSRPTGVFHVSSEPITKLALLKLINESFSLNLNIHEHSEYSTSKILLSEKLKQRMGFICPSWSSMVKQLALDSFNYG